MNYWHPYCDKIKLHVEGRISADDALRQERTAREVLRRLSQRPGVILADEVGMGKTFVALAAATSVAVANRGKRPVVVMVPPSLQRKWPTDFELFRERCLPREIAGALRHGRATKAVEFLKLLDDPPARRKQLIFVTHGAMSRGLNDKWVKLAIIAQAIRRKHGVGALRKQLSRVLGDLLRLRWVDRCGPEIWLELLSSNPETWLDILRKWGVDPEGDDNPDTDDDPVPQAVLKVLPRADTTQVFEALKSVPKNRTSSFESRLRSARKIVNAQVRELWDDCVSSLRLNLPLLILDEAHHLKNDNTRLASLFRCTDANDDVEMVARGPLAGAFERMLFLTATPFQLGHSELCNVIDRFDGIRWRGANAPGSGRESFDTRRGELRRQLDKAQEAAIVLDAAWGRLTHADVPADSDGKPWWGPSEALDELSPTAHDVRKCYVRAFEAMRKAEDRLRPWVIRHLKPRFLPKPHGETRRRMRLCGSATAERDEEDADRGIPLTGESLLPFLLAARASSHAPDKRPVFAEGLASSYEAFLQTRRRTGNLTDSDDEALDGVSINDASRWYLDQLEQLVPRGDPKASAAHPKIAATTARVLDIWRDGEKVLVFCHYVATGRTLRARISDAIRDEIVRQGARRLGCKRSEVSSELERLGERFFDEDSPVRRVCDSEVGQMLADYPELPQDELVEIVRRNVRTPSFLVRFFPLTGRRLDAESMKRALERKDRSGLRLRDLILHFFKFLVTHCGEEDRDRYIREAQRVQTGTYMGTEAASTFNDDELQGERAERLMPNVRLVNGDTKQETRQRLMLTFNTPFYPEVLIASSVMAEGVDLHLNCRHVIHHDLCWNPSTLEQRTGRIDRISAKAERCGQPIQVLLPYIAETQDEKMYRVVMDRERWFSVVMGEEYKVDVRTTDRLSERVPFPLRAAQGLAFRLEVDSRQGEAPTLPKEMRSGDVDTPETSRP